MESQQTVDSQHWLVEEGWSWCVRLSDRLSMRSSKGPASDSWGAAGKSKNVAELDPKDSLGILCIGQTAKVAFL